jgi:hypothetical protein
VGPRDGLEAVEEVENPFPAFTKNRTLVLVIILIELFQKARICINGGNIKHLSEAKTGIIFVLLKSGLKVYNS